VTVSSNEFKKHLSNGLDPSTWSWTNKQMSSCFPVIKHTARNWSSMSKNDHTITCPQFIFNIFHENVQKCLVLIQTPFTNKMGKVQYVPECI